MIHFEIISTPDLNIISPFQFFQNQIYLGRNFGDLWIQDPGLLHNHVMLEVVEKELLIHPQKGVEYYLINGKRATNVRKLKAQDSIQVANTTIKILSFEHTPFESKKDVLNQKLQKLIEEGSNRLPVIESLTKEMK